MSDEIGKVEMHLSIEGGRVVMRFQEPMQMIVFDPPNIQEIACRLTDLAFEAQSGLKPVNKTLKADLIQRHMEKLVPRLSLMFGTWREDKKVSDGQLAKKFVDICFHEIFS